MHAQAERRRIKGENLFPKIFLESPKGEKCLFESQTRWRLLFPGYTRWIVYMHIIWVKIYCTEYFCSFCFCRKARRSITGLKHHQKLDEKRGKEAKGGDPLLAITLQSIFLSSRSSLLFFFQLEKKQNNIIHR